MYLSQSATTSLISIRLTDKGRELLAKGFKDDEIFDIVKFSFGDSEIDYTVGSASTLSFINEPETAAVDFKTRLYASGTIPSGTPTTTLSHATLNLSTYHDSVVNAYTEWLPVDGYYLETYKWENLGPLNDYDFEIRPGTNTRSATIAALDVTGTTKVRIVGQTTGKYATFDLNIS